MQRPFVETTFVEPTLCGRAHCVFQCPNSGGSIYVGPQHVAGMRYLDELQAAGITGIVNCTESFPNYHEAAIEYCRVAVSDEAGANILIYLDGATSFIQRHLVAGNSCLVHCQMGISRSATIVLANLLRYQEMNLQQAYTHVKERRPLINPNTGFWKQLIVYQTRIRDASNSSVSETPILFDEDWAAQSLATYQTTGHLSEQLPELQAGGVIDSSAMILEVAVDFIMGRGSKESDLSWLGALCGALQGNSNVLDIVAALFQDHSEFMKRWMFDVSPEEIDRIMATVRQSTTACNQILSDSDGK